MSRPRTLRFAVIGDPIGHSKSPIMHAAALRALGLPHTYEAVRVEPGDLRRVVAALRDGTYDGLNVTVPHKERVLALVDTLDPSARVAGAANTLVRRPDGIIAHNTDAPALAVELRRLAMRARTLVGPGARALVLGSGGAARAAITALGVHLGVTDIVVRARSFADASRRDPFVAGAPCRVAAETWAQSAASEANTSIVVHATSAGMRGADPGDAAAAAVAWAALGREVGGAIALDVVYAPRDTPFLQAARARGIPCDDGLGMLAGQGALALDLWLAAAGTPMLAPASVMRAALE